MEKSQHGNNSLAPKLKWIHHSKIAVQFKWSCLMQDKSVAATKICLFSMNNISIQSLH